MHIGNVRTVLPPNNIGTNSVLFGERGAYLDHIFVGAANIETISFIPQGGVETTKNVISKPDLFVAFYGCYKLKTILGGINIASVLYTNGAFTQCYLLETIKINKSQNVVFFFLFS